MLAEKGEKLDAREAVTMISRFWPAVKTEYLSCVVCGRRGVVAVGCSSSCALCSGVLGGLAMIGLVECSRVFRDGTRSRSLQVGITKAQERYKFGVFQGTCETRFFIQFRGNIVAH